LPAVPRANWLFSALQIGIEHVDKSVDAPTSAVADLTHGDSATAKTIDLPAEKPYPVSI
jgi:hypothetical protein